MNYMRNDWSISKCKCKYFHILREEKVKLETIIEFLNSFLLKFCLLIRLMTSRDIPSGYLSLNTSLFLTDSWNSFYREKKTLCSLITTGNIRITSKVHLGLWILLRLDIQLHFQTVSDFQLLLIFFFYKCYIPTTYIKP